MSQRDVREFKCDRCGKTIYGGRLPDGLGYDISGIRDWHTATLIGDLCSDCWEAYKEIAEEFVVLGRNAYDIYGEVKTSE